MAPWTFAGVAVALAALGIFGVMSFDVTRRTREIGIRMALGAGRRAVMWWTLARAIGPTALGLGLGISSALVLIRLLGQLLFEVSPLDPTIYILAGVSLGSMALVAAYLPARRAAPRQ